MTFAVCLAVTVAICLTCDKAIKKYPYLFYIGAALLSVAAYCINEFVEVRTLAPFVRDYLIPVLTNALFATSFWTVVMFTGALKNGSKLIKKLMPIRGELSITAALLTIGHIVIYGMTYLKRLFSGRSLTFDVILFMIVAFILVVIMTPLTVISVKKIRKKMKGKTWKKIQKAAYVFYALTYFHVVLVLWTKIQRGNTFDTSNILRYIDLVIYTLVFGAYAVLRIRKYYLLRKKPKTNQKTNIVSSAAFAVSVLAIGLCAFPFAKLGKSDEVMAIDNSPLQSSDTVSEVSQNSFNEVSSQVSEIVQENTEVSTVSESTEVSVEESTVSQVSDTESNTAKESSVNATESSVTESSVQTSQAVQQQSSQQVSSVQSSNATSSQVSRQEPSQVSQTSRQTSQQTSKETSVVQQSSTAPVQTSKQETSKVQTSQPVQETSKTPVVQQSSTAPVQEISKAPVVQQSSTTPVQEPSKAPEPSVVEEPSKNVLYNDGTYNGQAYGYDGDIYVTVTVQGDKIVNITARSEEFEPEYFEDAEKVVIPAIISRQSANVDSVSGATFSSKGIMMAVQQALNSARI